MRRTKATKILSRMVQYDLAPDVDVEGSQSGKAWKRFQSINTLILGPVKFEKRQGQMREAMEQQWRIFVSGAVTVAFTVFFPGSFTSNLISGLSVFALVWLYDAWRVIRHYNRLPAEISEEGTQTYYDILMAQVLGRRVVNVRGILCYV